MVGSTKLFSDPPYEYLTNTYFFPGGFAIRVSLNIEDHR